MRVGLVLGAGGVTGEAYHRGVVRALHELGWDARTADVLVGTSAGSIVAASLRASSAGNPDQVPRAADPAAVPDPVAPPRARRLLLGPLRARPIARAMGLLPAGRIPTEFLSDGLDRRFGDRWPDRDIWIVAVRRRDGRRVVFGRSDAPTARIGEAVAASCAIPAYFTPVSISGTQYVDGGAHSPTNADVLRGRPLDLVVVSSPMSLRPSAARPTLDTPIRLRFHRYLNAELRRLHGNAAATLTFEPNAEVAGLMGLNMLSAQNIDEIEERTYADALRALRASGLAERLATARGRAGGTRRARASTSA
jgi:NTE family protein